MSEKVDQRLPACSAALSRVRLTQQLISVRRVIILDPILSRLHSLQLAHARCRGCSEDCGGRKARVEEGAVGLDGGDVGQSARGEFERPVDGDGIQNDAAEILAEKLTAGKGRRTSRGK